MNVGFTVSQVTVTLCVVVVLHVVAPGEAVTVIVTGPGVAGQVKVGVALAALSNVPAVAVQANVGVIEPGERHWKILVELLERAQCSGALVMDATLAAIAVEHGATLYSTDRDFSRFADLSWSNPLDSK